MRIALLLLLALIAGCSGTAPASKPADPSVGRDALKAALDAWKAGEPPARLLERSPPIRVADEDWQAGARLEDYKLGPDERSTGSGLALTATLTIKDKARGKKKSAVYDVGTDPAITVFRRDAP